MRLYSYATGEPVETVEMHVLAKAYRAAWRSVHAGEPSDSHVIAGADLVIDFGQIEGPAEGPRPDRLRNDVDGDRSEDNR